MLLMMKYFLLHSFQLVFNERYVEEVEVEDQNLLHAKLVKPGSALSKTFR